MIVPLELVAIDVRDSGDCGGGLDTVARRPLGTVDLIVAPANAARGEPATAWQRVTQSVPHSPLAWGAACLVSFVVGPVYGRRRRRSGTGDAPGVRPEGRFPYGSSRRTPRRSPHTG